MSETYMRPSVFSKFFQIELLDVRLALLLGGFLVYAFFGVPTADAFGFVEAVVGFCLVAAIFPAGVRQAFVRNSGRPVWYGAGVILFLYGVTILPTLAVYLGRGSGSVLRDMIPFLFMMIPVLVLHLFRDLSDIRKLGLIALLGGVVLSVRIYRGSDPLDYLANSPLILMAALVFAGMGMENFVRRFSIKGLAIAVFYASLCFFCMKAVIDTQQRASAGAFVLALIIWGGFYTYKCPRRGCFLIVAVGALALYCLPQLLDMWNVLAGKTKLVGGNARLEEWQAVWEEVSRSPVTLLFGQGWGASFRSPAVAEIEVYYTHGMLSSMLLKAGLIGFVLSIFYIFALLWKLCRLWRYNPVWSLALIFPIVIDTFLYASFKSLDFGIVLLLAAVFERGWKISSGQNHGGH